MALLLLSVVRVDLLRTWQSGLPADSPNKFLINIQPEQTAPLAAFLKENGIKENAFSPMIRGRLVAINGRPVSAADYPAERRWPSASQSCRGGSVAGQRRRRQVVGPAARDSCRSRTASPDAAIAGRQLTYDVAGQQVSAKVRTCARSTGIVQGQLLRAGHAGNLDTAAELSSLRFPCPRAGGEDDGTRARVSTLLIDVAEIMRQVQTIMGQVSRAVEFVFLFTLIAGILSCRRSP
jgi:putative ABC transport system permease protein